MEKIVLLCEDSIEGMLTAIYDGFVLKNEKFSGKPVHLPTIMKIIYGFTHGKIMNTRCLPLLFR